MSDKLNPLLARLQNEPALIGDTHTTWFEACVVKTSEFLDTAPTDELTADFWGQSDSSPWQNRVRPYRVSDGILSVPVRGMLLNKFPYAFEWATGYEYIWEAVSRGLDDSEVKGIALVIDSPGGVTAGMFDLVDKIHARRGEKPIKAYVDTSAYSAAYAIASVADDITVNRSGGLGSIGVVVVHMEMSKSFEANGITVDIVRSKPAKMEGSHYETLTKAARKRIQGRVDTIHGQFVELVARNRDMSESRVDNTDALTFMAEEAIEEGLADHVGSLDDSIMAFVASLNSNEGDDPMATSKVETIPLAEHSAALATAETSARAEGHAAGVQEERGRVSNIFASDAAKGRPTATLAVSKTSMTSDEAIAFLASLPEEAVVTADTSPAGAGAPAGMLAAAMGSTPNPELGTGADNDDSAVDSDAELMENISAYNLSGFTPQKGA